MLCTGESGSAVISRRLESEKRSAAEYARRESQKELEEVKKQCREEVEKVRV